MSRPAIMSFFFHVEQLECKYDQKRPSCSKPKTCAVFTHYPTSSCHGTYIEGQLYPHSRTGNIPADLKLNFTCLRQFAPFCSDRSHTLPTSHMSLWHYVSNLPTSNTTGAKALQLMPLSGCIAKWQKQFAGYTRHNISHPAIDTLKWLQASAAM